jgi:hypothetical protein
LSVAANANPEGGILQSYSGNLSDKDITFYSMIGLFGPPGMAVGEMVKFKAPKAGWNLENISILAWDGFNGTRESVPPDRVISLEVRDKDLNLLYQYTDSEIPYSNFRLNVTDPMFMDFEVPSIPVSEEFYVTFYDRGAIAVASELNVTANSYIFDKNARKPIPAVAPIGKNQTAPVNWIMVVEGS